MKPIILIANPQAGGQALKKKWVSEIHPVLKAKLPPFEIQFTKHQGHATTLARRALHDGYRLIVSMGGDGTLNEVVNGFFENGKPVNPQAALGVLPFGSGGDFIRTLRFPRDYRKALTHLLGSATKKIDLGRVHFEDRKLSDRYFINIADVGLVAAIMRRVNAKNKGMPSLVRYVTATFQGFVDHKNTRVRLTLGSGKKMEVTLTNLTAANGRYFGNGMRPAPHARLDDGLFDVVLLKNMTLLRFALVFPQLYTSKKRVPKKYVASFRTNSIRVEALNGKKNLNTELDGENYGGGNQTITLLPKILNLKV